MEKNTKTFNIDGIFMQFDSIAFDKFFKTNQKKQGYRVLDYEVELGDKLNVSNNAIHNWRFGTNGPVDVDTIKELAKYLSINDYKLLLKKGRDKTMTVTERQKDSLKRIYDAVIEYLDKFDRTDGFNDIWHDLAEQGNDPKYIEDMLYELAESEVHKVDLVIKKEYIEIHKLPVYDQLREYVWEDLYDTFDGKLSYAYRFEAPVEKVDGTPSGITTDEDYNKALKRINELLEVYM